MPVFYRLRKYTFDPFLSKHELSPRKNLEHQFDSIRFLIGITRSSIHIYSYHELARDRCLAKIGHSHECMAPDTQTYTLLFFAQLLVLDGDL